MNQRSRFIGLGLASLGLAYFLAWPTGLAPQAWTPPPDPGLSGPFAANDALASAERLYPGVPGPAALDVDAQGQLIAGTADGRILRLTRASPLGEAVGLAPVRAQSLRWLGPQRILVADERSGLWVVGGPERFQLGGPEPAGGFRAFSEVCQSASGQIYVLEPSTRHAPGTTYAEFLEAAPQGRLLRFAESRNTLEPLRADLHFPTGLACGPDADSLLIAEMSRYRLLRYWLSGPRQGQTGVFAEGLPGYPENLHWNGRDTLWVTLYGPRNAALDFAADKPWLRQLYARLPALLQPKPQPRAWVLGYNAAGQLTHNLQDASAGAYAPISRVLEHQGWLYFGSLEQDGLARWPLARAEAPAPAHPPPPSKP